MSWGELIKNANPRLFKGISGGILVIIAAIVWWTGKSDRQSSATEGLGRALLEKYSPEHARFTETSFLIDQNEAQKALEKSLAFLSKNQDDTPLRAFTLVRVAFLYQSLGQKENEMKAWQAVEKEAGTKNFALVEETFSCEGSGLRDYIKYRLRQLL